MGQASPSRLHATPAFRFYRAEGYLIPMHVRSASIGLRDIYTNACAFRFYRAERDIYTNACAFRFYRAEGYLIPMHVHSASIGLRTSSRAESALFVASSDLMVAVYARVRHS